MTPAARIGYTIAEMKQPLSLLIVAAAFCATGLAQKNPFLGRWDLTIAAGQDTYPDWMEVTEAGGKLDVLIQPRSGGARHATDAKLDGGKLIVTPGGGRGTVVSWELTAQGDQVSGSIKRGETAAATIAGVRAPALNRPMPKA